MLEIRGQNKELMYLSNFKNKFKTEFSENVITFEPHVLANEMLHKGLYIYTFIVDVYTQ